MECQCGIENVVFYLRIAFKHLSGDGISFSQSQETSIQNPLTTWDLSLPVLHSFLE